MHTPDYDRSSLPVPAVNAVAITGRSLLLGLIVLIGCAIIQNGSVAQERPSTSETDRSPLDTLGQRSRIQTVSGSPLRGVVWTPPDQAGRALRELQEIHSTGATAVRLTEIPASDTVFTRADTLDLQLFLDLPVAYVPASGLETALENARSARMRVETLAQHHPSVSFVGLARATQTTTSSACAVLQEWSTRIREQTSLRTYYVTPFRPTVDRCAESVDLTLLDTRGTSNQMGRWLAWRDHGTGAIGLGTLGTWVRPAADSGLRVPHSPEFQARHLETALSSLDTLEASPPTFVYRWTDQSSPLLRSRQYGIHDETGRPRPAKHVVSGFYTGTQKVFAFPSGTVPYPEPHAFILFGWGLFAVIAVLYAQVPFVRATLFRYFLAHGFYRNAVREARDINSTVNVILLLVVGCTAGLIVALVARTAVAHPGAILLLEALPEPLQIPLAYSLQHPIHAGGLVAAGTILLLAAWVGMFALIAMASSSFSLRQALMVVVWPCWPVLPGAIVAMTLGTSSPLSTPVVGILLLGGGLLTLVTVTVRVLRDFRAVNDGGLSYLPILLLPSPLLVLAGLTYITISDNVPFSLLWQLMTST